MRIERADLQRRNDVEAARETERPEEVRETERAEPRVEPIEDVYEREEVEAPEAEAREERVEERRELQSTLSRTAEDAEDARGVLVTLGMRESAVELEDVRDGALEAEGELALENGRERVAESEGPLSEEDLSSIGRGLDPSALPPQAVWNEEMINTYSEQGRIQGGLTEERGGAHAEIADKYKFEELVEFQPADVAALVKESGGNLEKTDPNQLMQATAFINEARDPADQQDRVRKTLDTFAVLENSGAPKLEREQMKEQLWAMARVPGHAIEKMSDAQLAKTFQEVAGKINAGPGQSEVKIGNHKLKITVDESGKVTDSSCKKPGFVETLKKVGKIALTVASFIPGPVGIAARIAQGVIAAISAAKNKNILGFVGAAASAFGAGAASLGGSALAGAARVANGVASAARGIQSVQRGGIAGIIGGAAGIAGGVAQAIGDSAQNAADQLQRVSNRLQPIGSVEAIRGADRALDQARDSLRAAEASGDRAAIASARAQVESAEQARRSSIYGGLSSAAMVGAELAGGSGSADGSRNRNQVRLDLAARGLDIARGINDRDFASVASAGLGAANSLRRGTNAPEMIETENGPRERFNILQGATDVADGLNGYRLSANAARDASRNVESAEASLAQAERSGDSAAIRQAREELRRARMGASDAQLAQYYAADAAAGTVHRAYGSYQDTRRADQTAAREAERNQQVRQWMLQEVLLESTALESNSLAAVDELEATFVPLEPDPEIESRSLPIDESWQVPSRTHEIQPGDRLEILAARYGVTVEEIRAANGNIDPRRLQIGEDLTIPGVTNNAQAVENLRRARANANPYAARDTEGGYYTVKTGDTLPGLSRRTGIPEAELLRLNPQLGDGRMLYENQRLIVPQVDLPDPMVLPLTANDRGVLPTYDRYIARLGNGPINENGVAQGQLGNCYMLASMASVARSQPELIRDAVRDNRDGTYTVRFFEPNNFGSSSEVFVTVDGQMPQRGGANAYANTADANQQWAPIIEKAYATRYGNQYRNINAGDAVGIRTSGLNVDRVLGALTGRPYRLVSVEGTPSEILWNRLQSDLQDKRPLVADSWNDAARVNGSPVVARHAYSVMGAGVENGVRYVDLRNPWGQVGTPNGDRIRIPYTQFRTVYERIWAQGNQVPVIH